jgi:enoyl-CoA hydratase/carnithine racemase
VEIPPLPDDLRSIAYDQSDRVATVTLDRPEIYNAIDERMQEELRAVWHHVRWNDDVRAVVLTGAGDKAFCTGLDRAEIPTDTEYDPFTYDDPGRTIGPKSQGLWKPVIGAVNGMACGGAFYLLGECDFLVAAEHATFFDPHVTYGMTASFEPILLTNRMAFGDLVRMALLGAHERLSAATARTSGLVSEVVPGDQLAATCRTLATDIAAQPPTAIQSTLRTLWASRNLPLEQATALGNVFLQLGTSARALREGQELFTQGRVDWRLR